MGAFPVPIPVIGANTRAFVLNNDEIGFEQSEISDRKWEPGNMSAMDYFV